MATKRPKPEPAAAEEFTSHLSARMKQLRQEKNWSLDSLSKACGVSRSMLSQIERNEVNPTLAVTFAIARAFGISISEVRTKTPSKSRISTSEKS